VCRHSPSCFPRIQDAVNEASPGDTVRVAAGVYREAVAIAGPSKRFIKLVGDPRTPSRVVVDGRTRGSAVGVHIDRAQSVAVSGITVRRQRVAGFLVSGASGYRLTSVRAIRTGVYGIRAVQSRGGAVSRALAAFNSGAGFSIAQSSPQVRPARTIISEVKAYGNAVGLSGVNARHVTVTRGQWYNNGAGIVFRAAEAERDPPSEDNVVINNDIFWNNFNFLRGAPFVVPAPAEGDVRVPVGAGIVLLGGRRHVVVANRVFGNYLTGIGLLQDTALRDPELGVPVANTVAGNRLGLGGADPNGRDLTYDGSGADNCFGSNTGVGTTLPADGPQTLVLCPFIGANAASGDVQAQVAAWLTAGADPEATWIRRDHVARPGVEPLETYAGGAR
jgi:hypothetical protein